MTAQTGTITTEVPARLDRLPWSKFHWRVLVGLGSVWILDGLEVTMVGNVASRMTEGGSGISISSAQIGLAGAIYVAGACAGALFFGQLTDRFGRKKLFMLTLAVYITATVLSAFAFAPWYFFIMRFFTGSGIGGEYSAINSAVDELIPARVRGRTDLIINGTYWAGAAIGAGVAVVVLNKSLLAADLGWRIAFALGAVIGLLVLIVRRHVPESPRWLFIHGREDEAEAIVGGIEEEVTDETGQDLSEPEDSITVRQREKIPFREIAKVAFTMYPKRAVLGLSLFVGQAFLYNGITFDLGTLLGKAYNISSDQVPLYFVLYAVASFLGPVLLGRLFDTVGRKTMIAFSYLGSAVAGIVLAWFIVHSVGGVWGFEAMLMVTFFLASSGASSAYLTVSEIFPMETRALAIAFFYAVGTAAGGIAGPLLFGRFIDSGDTSLIALGFIIGAVVMAVGGVAELLFGVNSEQKSLESIATPLTAEDAEQGGQEQQKGQDEAPEHDQDDERRARDERIRSREDRRRRAQTTGRGRYRPGPGRALWSPRMSVSDGTTPPEVLDREIESIARALAERGALSAAELSAVVGARFWGPGRFRAALREAVAEGRAERLARGRYGPGSADRTAGDQQR